MNGKENLKNLMQEPLLEEHFDNNEDYIAPEVEKSIAEELKDFAKQTLESGKIVAGKVASQVKEKANAKSHEIHIEIKTASKEMGNEMLSGAEQALNTAQEIGRASCRERVSSPV